MTEKIDKLVDLDINMFDSGEFFLQFTITPVPFSFVDDSEERRKGRGFGGTEKEYSN